MFIPLTFVVANHSSTLNPTPPATYPVLYADEYGQHSFSTSTLFISLLLPGFHTGNLLWRGRFSGTTATGVFVAVIGGTSRYSTIPLSLNLPYI
jgi:hypothetical protein